MQESDFEFDRNSLDESARRFPAHRQTTSTMRPNADVSYLQTSPGADFGHHVWDEGGHS